MLKLLQLVPQNCNIVVDVGSDHGILTKLMLTSGKARFVYATDISAPSLKKTEDLMQSSGLQSVSKCIVSDGLQELGENFASDCVVIAGMGGIEISKILSDVKKPSNNKTYLLQPAQDANLLREFLTNNNFFIILDEIIEEKGKFYSNILCKSGAESQKLSALQCYLGLNCNNNINEDYIKFVEFTFNKLNAIKQYLPQKDLHILQFCENILNKH